MMIFNLCKKIIRIEQENWVLLRKTPIYQKRGIKALIREENNIQEVIK